jgi:glucosamine 6-phosphate synthetase-like amidotransferase/phosphosugar isomerase protein
MIPNHRLQKEVVQNMCGIAGFCLNREHSKKLISSEIAGQLLYDIEHRGTDATGIAFVSTKTGKRVLVKSPIPATEFVKKGLNGCKYARTLIAHTRYATQGSPKNSHNNHPITRGTITLTHNGHCTNDTELFKQLNVSRIGKVDSEALAALIAFGKGTITERLEKIEGNAALAWIDNKNPDTLHLARVRTSPLWVGQSREGSVFYGSTKQTVTNASIICDTELDWLYEMQEGEYFKIVNGVIVQQLKFVPMPKPIVYNYKDQYTVSYSTNSLNSTYKWDDKSKTYVPKNKTDYDYYNSAWDLDDDYYFGQGKNKKNKYPF